MDNNLNAQDNSSQSNDAGDAGAGSDANAGNLQSSHQDGSGDAGGDAGAGGDKNFTEQQQQKSADAQKAAGDPTWMDAYPETMRDKLKDYGSSEAFEQAFNDGSLSPKYKSEDYKALATGEGSDPSQTNNAGMESFKEFCVEESIKPDSAQKLIKFQQELLTHAEKTYIEEGTKELKARWSHNFQPNLQVGLKALTLLDRKMGGRFAPAISRDGKINDPVVLEAAYELGMMIGEANLGAGGPSGAELNKTVTAEDSYDEIFKT